MQQEAAIRKLEGALQQDLFKENEELYEKAVMEMERREAMVKRKVRQRIEERLAFINKSD